MRSLQVLGKEDLEAVKELRMKTSETPYIHPKKQDAGFRFKATTEPTYAFQVTTQTETQPFKNLNLISSMNLTRHGR